MPHHKSKSKHNKRSNQNSRRHHHSYKPVLALALQLDQQQLLVQSAAVAATATSTAATSAISTASAALTASTTSAASSSTYTPAFTSYNSTGANSGKDTKWTNKNLISSSMAITGSKAPSSAATSTAATVTTAMPPSAEKLKFEEEFQRIYDKLPIQKSISGSELSLSIEHKVHKAVAKGLMFDNYLREMLTAFQYKTGRYNHVKEYGPYNATIGSFRTDYDAAVESFRTAFETLSKINSLVFGNSALEERDLRFSPRERSTWETGFSLLDRFLECIHDATYIYAGDQEYINYNKDDILYGHKLPNAEKNKIARYLASPLWTSSHHKMLRILIAGGFQEELIRRVKDGERVRDHRCSGFTLKVPKQVMDAIMFPENLQFQPKMVTQQTTNSANTTAASASFRPIKK